MQDGVVRGQDANEVFGMLRADIFDAKIVNAKGERDSRQFCVQNPGVSLDCV